MVEKKHISKIIAAIVTLALILCLIAIAFSDRLSQTLGGSGVAMAYESRLFDTEEIIQIDIQMDEDDWNQMLEDALAEEYVPCNVVINGERINNVAIRPKGNTSLSSIAMDPNTNRYSFKIEFDHYVKGQTCFGLDKLILNNNFADSTNMKEAVIYDMYQYLGAEASLYNFAKITVNGEYWGVYLALEAVEDSFLLRNFGTQDGELYKPDSMNMGNRDDGDSDGGQMPDGDFPDAGDSDGESAGENGASKGDSEGDRRGRSGDSDNGENEAAEETVTEVRVPEASEDAVETETAENTVPAPAASDEGESSGDSSGNSDGGTGADRENASEREFDGESSGGFGGGANLNYTNEELDSYSTIWAGEVTSTSKSDHRRVVTALKNISEGNDLETYMDVDNLLRYMAVHTFSVNSDSLSGGMAHNYYLYEYRGQLNMFPWDYNLSFGGMGAGGRGGDGASSMINDAIDSPFSATRFFDKLLEDETYLEQYHVYLRQLVEEYVFGGRFDEVYQRIRSQIDALVETDPTAFYNYEEYQAGAQMLYKTIKLRAESIEGQLDGIIPSTDSAQRLDTSALIDASEIDVATMGTFGMGGDNRGGFGDSDGGQAFGEAPDFDGKQGTGEAPDFDSVKEEIPTTIAGSEEAGPQAQAAQERPAAEFPGSRKASSGSGKNKNLVAFGSSLAILILAIAGVLLIVRRKR